MPISREAFQVRNPGDEDDLAAEFAEALDTDRVASIADPSGNVGKETERSARGIGR